MKKKINEQSEQFNKEVEQWKGKYLRALADYQNLEKRTQAEKQEIRKYAAEVVLTRLLPVLDTLSEATKHVQDMGIELALKELSTVLSEQGVEKIEVIGKPFNPHQMECIEVVAGSDNMVVEELLPGYRIHDKILRIAQVKVGKKINN